jgi:hypothetical protein
MDRLSRSAQHGSAHAPPVFRSIVTLRAIGAQKRTKAEALAWRLNS